MMKKRTKNVISFELEFEFVLISLLYATSNFNMDQSTITGPGWTTIWFNEAIEVSHGSFFILSFVVGTVGNIVSFLYFKSKKRNISNVIYMLTTVNDIVVSITSLQIAHPYLAKRYPGIIFGNKYSCAVWFYIWFIAIYYVSAFLVVNLCVARTLSLLRPFKKQKIKYVLIALTSYFTTILTLIAITHSLGVSRDVVFDYTINICILRLDQPGHATIDRVIVISFSLLLLVKAVAVVVSCIISVVVLTRKNKNVRQRELQQSRNRATVTILLFALLYGVCNLPLVISYTMIWFSSWTDGSIVRAFFSFDTKRYLLNAITTFLPAANSALNPILYFWRMKPLREYNVTSVKKILRLN